MPQLLINNLRITFHSMNNNNLERKRNKTNPHSAELKIKNLDLGFAEEDYKNWQGQRDSNSRHLVLETSALPAELYPFNFSPVISQALRRVKRFFLFWLYFLYKMPSDQGL